MHSIQETLIHDMSMEDHAGFTGLDHVAATWQNDQDAEREGETIGRSTITCSPPCDRLQKRTIAP